MKFCPLFSGSTGNSIYVRSEKTAVLIDAGRSAKDIEAAVLTVAGKGKSIDGILVTHEHSDHIKGVGIISRKYDIPVYANAFTMDAMEKTVGALPLKNLRVFNTEQDFFIKDICVYPFSTPHDAADSVGYCLLSGGKKVSVMTDLGYMPPRLIDMAAGSDVLLIESNHDVDMLLGGPYPYFLKKRILGNRGHLSNDAAASALLKICEKGVGQIILGHLSEKNNTAGKAVKTCLDALLSNGIDCDIMLAGKAPGAYRLREASSS